MLTVNLLRRVVNGPAKARVAVIAAMVVAVAGCAESRTDPEQRASVDERASRAFADAPVPLRALYDERNELLDGGAEAFEQRIAKLRGYPVVVNKWASWCGPCRAEFPVFQQAAIRAAKRVAFIGVNSSDNDDDARAFLEEFPLPFPSYKDPELKVARVFNGVGAFPTTAFYDRRGKVAYVHQGPYDSVDELLDDVRKYTGGN